MLYLQQAVDCVFERIGKVVTVSQVYETPAWGFEGEDFLNACIKVETRFSAEKVLRLLLEIEAFLGRSRNGNGYQNRTIDLDIIFYAEEIVDTKNLQLPHPKMTERKFVMDPLADIAAEVIHPKLKQSVHELKVQTVDDAPIQVYDKSLKTPGFHLPQFHYLAIEGNIGAGKTSLSTMISQDFKAKHITERYKDNAFLPKFYEDQARYAFPLEMSFLADRYQQLLDDLSQYDLFNDFMVADYDVYKSFIFAKVTLAEEEFHLYKKLFDIMYKDLAKPDLYVYLYQNTERLLQNIKKRGREYEQNIPEDYLNKINESYLEFIRNQHHLEVKIIDISKMDFVNDREDYLKVLREISSWGASGEFLEVRGEVRNSK